MQRHDCRAALGLSGRVEQGLLAFHPGVLLASPLGSRGVLWPDLIVIGGGISKKSQKYLAHLRNRTRIVTAEMHNDAGIAGAALAAIPVTSTVQAAE